MLRYGRGNPLAYLLDSAPVLYYVLLALVSICGSSLLLTITKLIVDRNIKKQHKTQ